MFLRNLTLSKHISHSYFSMELPIFKPSYFPDPSTPPSTDHKHLPGNQMQCEKACPYLPSLDCDQVTFKHTNKIPSHLSLGWGPYLTLGARSFSAPDLLVESAPWVLLPRDPCPACGPPSSSTVSIINPLISYASQSVAVWTSFLRPHKGHWLPTYNTLSNLVVLKRKIRPLMTAAVVKTHTSVHIVENWRFHHWILL